MSNFHTDSLASSVEDSPENLFMPTAWNLNVNDHDYGENTSELILAERQVEVEVGFDKSVRPKVVDSCGLTCVFCHNEGTPVAQDNRHSNELLQIARSTGRVSVFSATNGVDFLPGKMIADDKYTNAIAIIKGALELDEMHMTGGEPTLHTGLPALMAIATNMGYEVKMTSNGENGRSMIPQCVDAGLSQINFSIFGTNAAELASVQNIKYQNELLAQAKLNALHQSIDTALDLGISVSANIVMSGIQHAQRVKRLLSDFGDTVSIRILPDLDVGNDSYYAIYSLLAELGATPKRVKIEAGSSNARTVYELPNGREVIFKQIRPTRLKDTCKACPLNNDKDCKEGYYGVRLYVDEEGDYRVGVCLQRMDLTMPIEKFVSSSIASEVVELRRVEYERLKAYYNNTNRGAND